MKARARCILKIGWIVVVPLLVGGCLDSSSPPDSAVAVPEPQDQIATDIPEAEAASTEPEEDANFEKSMADAAFQPVISERVVPASLSISPVLAELLHLADSGVEESVMLAFVTNTPGRF